MSRSVFKFKDDEIEGSVNVVIKHIISYGITTGRFSDNTGLPADGLIWINTGDKIYCRNLSYAEAISVEEDITEAIHLFNESEYEVDV